MDLSVVIPVRNCAGLVGEQLTALSQQRWQGEWEVVVVDNGSDDATCAVARQYENLLPHLRVIEAPTRPGAAHARNAGVAAARGRAIAFCDADDRVGAGWLAAMGDALERHPFVAARLDFAELNTPQISQGVKNPQKSGLQRVEYPPYFHHASGGTLGIAREVHAVVGGFDEDLLYLEDADYCLRVQRRGIPLQFCPDALVHYRLKERKAGLFHQARYWGQYNVLLYKRYRENMRLEKPWLRHLKRWYSLLRRAPSLLHPQQRYVWIKACGTQVGVLQGALRHGVAPVTGWLLLSLAKAMPHLEPMLLHAHP